MTYSEKVPVMVGSKIIDRAMGMITKGELEEGNCDLETGPLWCIYVWVTPASPQMCRGDRGAVKGATPSTAPNPTAPKEFCLDDVQGHIHTTERDTIPQFGTINIHSKTDVHGHCMQVHVLAKPAQGPRLPATVVQNAMYGELCPGSS